MSRLDYSRRHVVITGASSGLGKACALHLDAAGFHVLAGVRKEEDGAALAALASARLRPLRIDVTRADSIAEAARDIEAAVGQSGLHGLVNNAGVCVVSPVECVPPERLRMQLETNVVGHVAIIQALLPLLRRARGRIVNVSSGLGRVAPPFMGAYAASQFAKEAMTDVLRRELAPSGVSVSLVQPGAIMTPIWGKISEGVSDLLRGVAPERARPYLGAFERFLEQNENAARASKTTPEQFARAVLHALSSPRPRRRYPVGPDALGANVLGKLLPDAALDAYFAWMIDRRGAVAGETHPRSDSA